MTHLAVGVDLGGTAIKAGLISLESGLVKKTSAESPANDGPGAVMDRIAAVIEECVEGFEIDRPVPIGLGSPGVIDLGRTSVSHPPNFEGWGVVKVDEELRRRLPFPVQVIVENDANVAALGSSEFGAGRAFDSFIMVTLGTGVGGAIIHEGRLFRGVSGGAGELGHVSIDYEGPLAKSGVAGAVEAYIGQRFLSRRARYVLMHHPESLVHNIAERENTRIHPAMLFEAASKGDRPAQELLAWAGHKLGVALGSAINLLDIRKVVVGGGLSNAGEYLLEATRDAVIQFVTPALADDIEVVRESRGNEIGILGAGALALHEIAGGKMDLRKSTHG